MKHTPKRCAHLLLYIHREKIRAAHVNGPASTLSEVSPTRSNSRSRLLRQTQQHVDGEWDLDSIQVVTLQENGMEHSRSGFL